MYYYNSIKISLNILCNSLQFFFKISSVLFIKFIDKINLLLNFILRVM